MRGFYYIGTGVNKELFCRWPSSHVESVFAALRADVDASFDPRRQASESPSTPWKLLRVWTKRLQLGPVAKNTGEWLHQWTQKSPNAVSLAERSGQGWREVRYAELLDQVGTVASSLLARGLGPETAIAIICGN